MKIKKYNMIMNQLVDFEVPDDWKLSYNDNNIPFNCPNCGKLVKKGILSHRYYHNTKDEPYYECKECYDEYKPFTIMTNLTAK